MERILKISNFLKKSQSNLEAWQAVKDEVESNALPEGLVDVEEVNNSLEKTKVLVEKTKEAKAATDNLSQEEKGQVSEALKDPDAMDAINDLRKNNIIASDLVDILFIKISSKYISERDAINLVNEINLYKKSDTQHYKIASANNFKRIISENEIILDKIIENEKLSKQADLSGIWNSAKNIGSKVYETAGKGLGYIANVGKYSFKLLGTILPILGVFVAAHSLYESYTNLDKALNVAASKFSDLLDSEKDNILSASVISGLIKKFSNNPEKLLRVAQLNKIGNFYKKNWYDTIYNALWFVSDFIFSLGIIISAVATAGIGATIEAPLGMLIEKILGRSALYIAETTDLASFAGSIALYFFGFGVGEYTDNNNSILEIANKNIQGMSSETGSNDLSKIDPALQRKQEEQEYIDSTRNMILLLQQAAKLK